MPERKTDRRMGDVLGVITPGSYYDTDAVLEFTGIGEVRLRDLRAAKQLKAFRFCGKGRNWYRAEDLIGLFVSEESA